MSTRFFAAVGSHRRVVLVAAAVASAGYVVAHHWMPSLGQRAFPVLTGATVALLLLALIALTGARPLAFVVRSGGPAFGAPPHPFLLFLALSFLALAAGSMANVVRDWGSDPLWSDHS